MVFFERCVKSVSLIGDSVDRTAETQVSLLLKSYSKHCIIDWISGQKQEEFLDGARQETYRVTGQKAQEKADGGAQNDGIPSDPWVRRRQEKQKRADHTETQNVPCGSDRGSRDRGCPDCLPGFRCL